MENQVYIWGSISIWYWDFASPETTTLVLALLQVRAIQIQTTPPSAKMEFQKVWIQTSYKCIRPNGAQIRGWNAGTHHIQRFFWQGFEISNNADACKAKNRLSAMSVSFLILSALISAMLNVAPTFNLTAWDEQQILGLQRNCNKIATYLKNF